MERKKGLNANQLKTIAIIAMTVDHLVWTVCPGYSTKWWVLLLHIVGRLTAPIMWYFIAEGYHHFRCGLRFGCLPSVVPAFVDSQCLDSQPLGGIFRGISAGATKDDSSPWSD